MKREAIRITCKEKKNRIILSQKEVKSMPIKTVRTALNGYLVQDKDLQTETKADFKTATKLEPSEEEKDDLVFAAKLVKNTNRMQLYLQKDGQLLASGTGQTSRVDALQQAIVKAKSFWF